jgi:hypothetical protein
MTPDERECMRVLCERIVEEKDYDLARAKRIPC